MTFYAVRRKKDGDIYVICEWEHTALREAILSSKCYRDEIFEVMSTENYCVTPVKDLKWSILTTFMNGSEVLS